MLKLFVVFKAQKYYRFLVAILAVQIVGGCLQSTKNASEKAGTLNAALWELAKGSEAANEYEKAASYFDRIYQSHPKNKKALLGYARNLRYLGLPKESIKAIQSALKNIDIDTDLKIELAKSQLAASLIHDAKTTLNEAAQAEPERWEIYSALGIINDRFENYREAQNAYKRALELSPNNVDVTNNLALSLAQSGELSKAINILQEIVRSEKSSMQSRQNLALLYGLSGQLNKAKELGKADLTDLIVDQNISVLKELHASNDPIVSKFALSKSKKLLAANVRQADARQHRTQQNTPMLDGVYFTLGETNVHPGPAVSHKSVGLLKKGDEVRLLGYSLDKKWVFVELPNGSRGYIDHKLLQKTDSPKKLGIVGQQDQ